MAAIKDSDGVKVTVGCTIQFTYGIPPVRVLAPVVKRGGKLIALSDGHRPSECPVRDLREHVGDFWVRSDLPRHERQ